MLDWSLQFQKNKGLITRQNRVQFKWAVLEVEDLN